MRLGRLVEHRALGIGDHGGDGRRPRVAPGAAVDVDDHAHARPQATRTQAVDGLRPSGTRPARAGGAGRGPGACRRPSTPRRGDRALAAVDDDLHVGIVGVVGRELVVQLGDELLGDDAVDHRLACIRRDARASPTSSRRDCASTGTQLATASASRPPSSAAALAPWSSSASSLELGPLLGDAHPVGLVGEVDLVAVPRQLPGHDDRHDAGALGTRVVHGDRRRPERASDPRDRARMLGHVEELERAHALHLVAGGHRVDVALAARRAARAAARRRRSA